MIVLARPGQLDLAQYRRIVVGREPVALDPAARAGVGAARERLLSHLDTGVSAYGVNTGVGYLAGTRPGRERDDERILFWHRGLATTDIALGQALLDRAVEQDAGLLLPYR